MHLSLQYLDLRKHFRNVSEQEAVQVTIDELSQVFFCTTRNVKMIVKKLQEIGYIEWRPGRGRGNSSTVIFKRPLHTLLLEMAQDEMRRGEIQSAFDYISKYGEETEVKSLFMEWLSGYFGYDSVQKMEKDYQTLRFPIYQTITTMDPAWVYSALDAHMVRQIFDTLVSFNMVTNTIEPKLAHHWQMDEEGKQWIFHLRKGVHFHHGRELHADDVVYSYSRSVRSHDGSAHSWLFDHMVSIEALNALTIRITLSQPNYLFLRYLCSPSTSIVPRDVVDKLGTDFGKYPVGSGPFRLVKHSSCQYVLEANPSYYMGRAHLDRVEIVRMPADADPFVKELECNELIHFGTSLKWRFPDWNQIEEVRAGCSMLSFNVKKDGPQRDRKFRQAIHHLIDRQNMVEQLGESRIMPSQNFIPSNQTEMLDTFHNAELAHQLLEEIAYVGEPFHLYVCEKHQKDALYIQEQCLHYSIQMEVHLFSITDFLKEEIYSQADCVLNCLILDEGEVTLIEIYQHGNSFVHKYAGEEIASRMDRSIDEILKERSEPKRQAMFDRVRVMLLQEHTITFLIHHKLNSSFHPSLHGICFNSLGWVDFNQIWIQPESYFNVEEHAV